MLRGCWSWTRYGDTSFGGVLGTGVPLNSPMVAPPAQHTAMRETSPMLSCSTGGHRQHSSVPRRRGRRRNGLPFSNASKLLWLPRGEFAYIHAYMLWSFTCIVSRGEEENRSRHPHLANRVIARTLFFSEPMTAFPRNGHVLYKDLPTPYQLSGNNSWGSFLQSKTVWDWKIEARLCFTWSVGQKHSSAAQAQETRDASILMMLGPCTHATAPRAPASCQGSTFELVDKSDAYENIAQMVRACFSRGNCLRFPSVGEMVRDSR